MASNEALERKTVIAGPTMLGIEAGWDNDLFNNPRYE